MLENKIIQDLENNGFRVRGRNIQKKSKRRFKTVGLLNENSFYFFSENVYPYKGGINFFNESTLVDIKDINKYKDYFKETEVEENEFKITFDDYLATTKNYSIFKDFLNNSIRSFKGANCVNYYDLRGIADGYLKDSVCFPFFDYNNNFKTAQIINYDTKGKRVKNSYSTSWLHSYKTVKKDLDLNTEDKYVVSNIPFFGENYLFGSDNPVAIVEAPKTAVLLKELYPDIDWLATAGETAIRNKDLKILQDKDVILFPDAKTTLWKEFAEENSFSVSNLLESKHAPEGSDLADFIFDFEHPLFYKIHSELFAINDRKFSFEYNQTKQLLNFGIVKADTSYFTAVPFKNGLVVSKDNSYGFKKALNGLNFDLYESKYQVINAQLDFNTAKNELEFVRLLKRCYLSLKFLNPDKDYLKAFYFTLNRLVKESKYRFNLKYVKTILIPLWDLNPVQEFEVVKLRDWKLKNADQVSKEEFIKNLNDEKFRLKVVKTCEAFLDVLEEDRFILLETDLFLSGNFRARGFKLFGQLVDDFNKEFFGYKRYSDYVKNQSKLTGTYIYKYTLVNFPKEKLQLAKNQLVKKITKILQDFKEISPIRADNRIIDFEMKPKKNTLKVDPKYYLQPEEAFLKIEQLKKELKRIDISEKYRNMCLYEIEQLEEIKKNLEEEF